MVLLLGRSAFGGRLSQLAFSHVALQHF